MSPFTKALLVCLPETIAAAVLKSKQFWRLWAVKCSPITRRLRRLCVERLVRAELYVVTLRNEDGFLLTCDIDRDHGIARNMFINGNYEAGTCEAIETLLPRGGVFVDAGANLGWMSLLAARCVGDDGRVLALECNPETLRYLHKNIRDNGMKNITVCESVVADTAGTCFFMQHPTNAGSCRIVSDEEKADLEFLVRDANNRRRLDLTPGRLGQLIDVCVTGGDIRFDELSCEPFSSILENEGIDHVDVMKLDIEGAEIQLLRHADRILKSETPPIVIAECSRVMHKHGLAEEVDADKIWLFFSRLGWSAYRRTKGKNIRHASFVLVSGPKDIPDGAENLYFFPPGRKPQEMAD